nr:hypothetical protein [Tanacetum cinerariifolium]
MQETKLPKKLKKKEMIQLSLDEELAQKLYAEELAKEEARQEQKRYNLEKALETGLSQKLKLEKYDYVFKESRRDQVHTFVPKDSEIEREFMKRAGFDLQQEISKKHRLEQQIEETEEKAEAQGNNDPKVEELKLYIRIIPEEDIAIKAIPLAIKPPVIIEYKIVKEEKISTYYITRVDRSTRRYTSMINLLENIDREELETLWKLVKDKYGNTRPEEGYERVL